MVENDYIIDIDSERHPYNSYMVLPMNLLQRLAPLIKDEILKGLVNNEDKDRVMLYLFLEPEKIKKIEKVVTIFERELMINRKARA